MTNQEPCRVLHLITRFASFGGAETTTENALLALAEENIDYDLRLGFGSEYDDSRVKDIERKGIQTECFDHLENWSPVSNTIAVFSVAMYLRQESIDIIHTHSTEAGLVGRWAALIARTPTVIHEIHGDPISAEYSPLFNSVLRYTERASAPIADRLIIKSPQLKQTFLERGIGSPAQYELIYHGVDLDRFNNSTSASTADSPVTFVFVGRIEESKGVFDLLTAFDRARKKCNINLKIVGEGPQFNEFLAAVDQRDLDDSIAVLGYQDDVATILSESDVFVLPSYREGTPRVITEALAAGLPVIASDVGGIADQVIDGESGYLMQPGDVDTLSKKIVTLATSSDLRREMSQINQSHLNKFSVEESKEEYKQIYREIIYG